MRKLQVLARRCGLMLARRWSLLDCGKSVDECCVGRSFSLGSGDLQGDVAQVVLIVAAGC